MGKGVILSVLGGGGSTNASDIFLQNGVDLETNNTRIDGKIYKVAYFAAVSSNTGTVITPTGSEIQLGQFPSGRDAYVNTIVNGQPTGENPKTAGGVMVTVTSLDVAGSFVLSDIPSAYPVSLIYILTITLKDINNLVTANIIEWEEVSNGDVLAPITNTADYIPQWDGANSKTLKNGLPVPAGGLAGLTVQNSLLNDRVITKEPTGFVSPKDVIINYDPTSQKITLTGTVIAYYRGTDISIANPTFGVGWVSTGHPDVTGHTYFLYYNGTAFAWADNSFPGFDMVLIAIVNYGATDKYAIRECHGFQTHECHKIDHYTIGTYKSAGGGIPSASYTLNSTTASARRPSIDSTTLEDEDCTTVVPALTSQLYTKYSLTGASVGTYTVETAEIIRLLVNNPYYNSFTTPNWGQTLMPSNSVASVWVLALPVTSSAGSQQYRYLFIQPQWVTLATSGSAGNIAIAVNNEKLRLPSELNLGTLTDESPELLFIGRIIIDFTTNWRLQFVQLLTGNRFSQIGSPSGNFLTTVTTDSTITGAGTVASPLSISTSAALDGSYGIQIDNRPSVIAAGEYGGTIYATCGLLASEIRVVECSDVPIAFTGTIDIWIDNTGTLPPTVADTILATPVTVTTASSATFTGAIFVGGVSSFAISKSAAIRWKVTNDLGKLITIQLIGKKQ